MVEEFSKRPEWEEVRFVGLSEAQVGGMAAITQDGGLPPLPLAFVTFRSFPPGTSLQEITAASAGHPAHAELDAFSFAMAPTQARILAKELAAAADRAEHQDG